MQVIRRFSRDAAEVPRARRFVADALERSGRQATDEVMLVTSELVSNAVRHGRDPVELHLELDTDGDRLHLEVIDAGGVAPQAPSAMPEVEAEGGRGLPLVAALSESWGSAVDAHGHTAVWADLPAPSLERWSNPPSCN
jgi:anti-sigma regulatory factor (Ser/Thr protein kinase)